MTGWTEDAGRLAAHERSHGYCEVHGLHRGHELSHRRDRSKEFGVSRHAPTNVLWVCRPAHAYLHRESWEVQAVGGGWRIVRDLRPVEAVPVWLWHEGVAGWHWLGWDDDPAARRGRLHMVRLIDDPEELGLPSRPVVFPDGIEVAA